MASSTKMFWLDILQECHSHTLNNIEEVRWQKPSCKQVQSRLKRKTASESQEFIQWEDGNHDKCYCFGPSPEWDQIQIPTAGHSTAGNCPCHRVEHGNGTMQRRNKLFSSASSSLHECNETSILILNRTWKSFWDKGKQHWRVRKGKGICSCHGMVSNMLLIIAMPVASANSFSCVTLGGGSSPCEQALQNGSGCVLLLTAVFMFCRYLSLSRKWPGLLMTPRSAMLLWISFHYLP